MRNLLYLLVIGVIVYAVITLIQRSRSGPGGATRGVGRRPKAPKGPLAPDDDPAFLWQLEQDRRRAERDAKGTDAGDGGDGSDQDQPGSRGTAP